MRRLRRRSKDPRDTVAAFGKADLLRWLYLARMTLVSGILLGAFWVWAQVEPQQTLLATSMFLIALLATGGSVWHTHVRNRQPSQNFLYGQVILDVVIVTGVVHVTGGGSSNFAWLYILVISEGALLLPLPGGVLIGALAAIFYFADIVWGHSETLSGSVVLQIGLFASVALATGFLGDRLRRAGMALGAAQTELRRLRTDTGDILETISTGVATVDQEGHLVYMNPAAEGLLGLASHEWRGFPVLDAMQKVAPGLAEIFHRSLEGGVTLFRHQATVWRGGDRITLGVSTTVREEEGVQRAVTAIFQDITALERLDALDRRNARLEAVAELSAAMAHEIKNPLASIRSAAEQFAKPTLSVQDRDILVRMVIREADRLSRLLSDFIDFSRVRLGRLGSVRVDTLMQDCTALVRRHPTTSERGVRIEVDPIPHDLTIPADLDLLHRALFNLLLNAVQFSPDKATVQVTVEDLGVSGGAGELQVPNPVRIRIRDSGPGIPEEVISRVFDPFFTTRPGGSGLGLSVVHRAVEAHRGVVVAGIWEAGGAEFSVYLPGKEPAKRGGLGEHA